MSDCTLSGFSASSEPWTWEAYLSGAPTSSRFPAFPRGTSADGTVAQTSIDFPSETARLIGSVAAAEHATVGDFLATAVQVLLSRSAAQDDVVIDYGTGMMSAGGPLPLRTPYGDARSFRDHVRKNAFVTRARRGSMPLAFHRCQVLVAVVDAAEKPAAPQDHPASLPRWWQPGGQLDHDIVFLFHPGKNGWLTGKVRYRTSCFDEDGAGTLAARLLLLVESAVRAPGTRVCDLALVPEGELARLLRFTDTDRPYPCRRRLHDLIREQADRTPEAVAVQDETCDLTYRQLCRQAQELASRLRAAGVRRDVIVAVCAQRSAALVVALLGILFADGAFLPLDARHPSQRVRDMVSETGARIILADDACRARARAAAPAGVEVHPLSGPEPASGPRTAMPSGAWLPTAAGPGGEAVAGFGSGPDDTALAYVIYTSGSTGRPKGVAVEHRGIVNRLRWMQSAYEIGADDVVLQKTPYTFDVSVWEFFWPLQCGARVVMARPDGHQDPGYLARIIQEAGVTTVHFVPPMLDIFVEGPAAGGCRSLRRVFSSGECLPASVANRFRRTITQAQLHNLYGPTEASIDVTYWPCRDEEPDGTVPIGRPLDNVRAYVLEKSGRLAPLGAPGELALAGPALARGYLGRPGLTAERFVPDSTPLATGGRLYRTGDLVRWHPSGRLEYLGRLDDQVKMHGLRVEPGEIENRLRQHRAVRDAAVIVRHDMGLTPRLVAYVVARDDAAMRVTELERHIAEYLPEGMIPSAFVEMSSLPLGSHGKLDRTKLPKPRRSHRDVTSGRHE